MDGLSGIIDSPTHEPNDLPDEEDVGENSNGSSNAAEGHDEEDSEMTRISSKIRGSSVVAANAGSLHRHSGVHNSSEVRNSGPRANYCQFETPADETRGTFPDDFDEELFITTGQIVESGNEAGQFDEEMDSSHSHHPDHNHLDLPLNLDTADHSESSDIEEIIYPTAKSTFKTTPTGSSSNSSSSSGSSSVSTTNRFQSHRSPPPLTLTSPRLEPLDVPMAEDLNSNGNADEHDLKTQVIHVGDDDVNDLEDPEPNASSSSMVSSILLTLLIRNCTSE